MSRYLRAIVEGLRTDPRREALVHHDRRISHGEVLEAIYRTARALAGVGLRRGDAVACLTTSEPEAVITKLAAQLLGCCHVQLWPKMAPPVQAAALADAAPKALVFSPTLQTTTLATLALTDVPVLLSLGPADAGRDLLALAARASAAPVGPRGGAESDPAQIMYTSGTTGTAKAAVHTFANASEFLRMERWLHGPEPRRFLLHGPLESVAGENVSWTLAAGGTAVLLDNPDPAEVLETVAREEITYLLCYPNLLAELVTHTPGRLPALRQIEYGSAPASARTVRDALAAFGPRLLHVYGQRECGFLTTLGTAEHTPELLRSAGRPFPGVTIEIRDADGCPLPTGETGEVWARSPAVMTGYCNRPEATADVLRDGWLRTGDLGRLDPAGHLYLADRAHDMIIVDGYNVYPSDVEEALTNHPAITHAAAVGLPHDGTGETVHIAVVTDPDTTVTLQELRALIRRTLGPYYEPTSITFLPELPLTTKGHPDRRALRAAAMRAAGR
ncbi:class I adenylate-forming enzyme family protein [Nocardia sp. NPDC057663]|uniref:class I adenylate-forming enzyme family protein n=1 Tax=Nocardia sp. NPDC057663 TaxID=3346201 RepID=UPI00366DFAD4